MKSLMRSACSLSIKLLAQMASIMITTRHLQLLSPHLCKTFTHFADSSQILKVSLEAVVATIPKLGKSPAYFTNYKSISFLSHASHLSYHIPHFIHPDQVDFVPQRQAPDGTKRFINLIQWGEHYRTSSLLLSLDAEKTFDKVHWLYLREVLPKFGLQGTFASAILSLYPSPSARVRTSCITSTPFSITNGVRQGCLLSPLIFALVMEPLSEAIRTHPLISGIQVGSITHKIGLYVDDVMVAVTNLI